MKAKSKQTHDLVQGINSTNNLALKDKKMVTSSKIEEVEEVGECNEDEEEASFLANDFEEDLALLVKKYTGTIATKGKNFKGKTFGRRKC